MPMSPLQELLCRRLAIASLVVTLAACGSGGADGGSDAVAAAPVLSVGTDQATASTDAYRLASQASFGANETLVAEIQQRGPARWIALQFDAVKSDYPNDYDLAVMTRGDYCFVGANAANPVGCQIKNYSTNTPQLAFWSQAVSGPDQLRQRVAFMFSEIFVNSEAAYAHEVRNYQQIFRDQAFGNYRDLLRKVTLSPAMGDWLNLVNSPGGAPNENYARELMELFTIGRCALNMDGSLVDDKCNAPYSDTTVAQYAKALSGWTYPQGPYPDGIVPVLPGWCMGPGAGGGPSPCPDGRVSAWYVGDMSPSAKRHNLEQQTLLSKVVVPANTAGPQALEKVLDSLMQHPSMAPFVAKHYIQFFVTSNPSPGYVQRVAQAFASGSYRGLGAGAPGDLKATIAATLLDDEARSPALTSAAGYGKLREPVLYMTAAMRALNATTDGAPFSGRYGRSQYPALMWQTPFESPTVFNFFHMSYPVPGANELNGPEFEIANLNSNFGRANFGNWLLFATDWSQDPNTRVDTTPFESLADDVPALVDRLDAVLTGGVTPAAEKALIASVVQAWPKGENQNTDYRGPVTWQYERVANAAYLLMTSAKFQIQR
jgi:uncharacterized protein (DUF1800 family)